MSSSDNPMAPFAFLLGSWHLEYKIPESHISPADGGEGEGTFRRILNDTCVQFDYNCVLSKSSASARAIFAWDARAKIYRLYWFEDSGNFSNASGSFVAADHLHLQWHDSVISQSFRRTGKREITLDMYHPDSQGEPQSIMTVKFTPKNNS